MTQHYIIVGGGQAGASLAAKLRSEGFEGDVTLIGAEPVPPYQRPPLSKAYLQGEMSQDRLYLRPAEFYADHAIALELDCTATAIDADQKRVMLSDGRTMAYDKLALTTGATPRRLPAAIGGDLDGVLSVRSLSDADAMAPYMTEGRHVMIVGGGYIGLEAAAVAAKRGMQVTVVEMADRILQRVAAPQTSDYFRALHRQHGVDIREGVGLERLVGDGHVTAAVLSDGAEPRADVVIAGVGIVPETTLAQTAGLMLDNGIATDAQTRTSNADIYAAGDCASCLFQGQRVRVESVGNAIDMAEIAARNMMGQGVEYVPRPWFWSDQYDCKLQIAGLNLGYDAVHVRQTGLETSHWYYRAGQLCAVDAMNDPRAYMVGKRLIEAGKSPDPASVTDPETDLKALLRA